MVLFLILMFSRDGSVRGLGLVLFSHFHILETGWGEGFFYVLFLFLC